MKRFISGFFMLFFIAATAIAQEHKETKDTETNEKETSLKGFHQFGVMLSHSHVQEEVAAGEKKWVSAPSFGLDYNYWFHDNWAVGLHTDLITETFMVKENGATILERSNPFAAVPAISFKPKVHSIFVAGMGAEFAKEGNFAITRLGYEYAWELPKRYELSLGLNYDIKWNAYDIWSVGIIVSKLVK